MAFLVRPDGKPIDVSDPNNLNPTKILPEYQYRKNILAVARDLGIEYEIIRIFDKYDRLMRLCPRDDERRDISKLGILEIHACLSKGGNLYINNDLASKG